MFGLFKKESDNIQQNSKTVKRWLKEHDRIKKYAILTLEHYNNDDHKAAKKSLSKLEDAALEHLMDEDNKIFELLDKAKKSDEDLVEELLVFRSSFRDVKHALVHFLITYSHPQKVLDDQFKQQLEGIIQAVVDRIEFEESRLYPLLSH